MKTPDWLAPVANSRAAVLGILFFVTGVLGLPLLWVSSRFTRTQKIVLSVVVTIYTAALIAGTYAVLAWSWSVIQQNMR